MRIGVAQGRRFVEVADFGSPASPVAGTVR